MARAYLDHASVSPLRPEAKAALVEWLGVTGDPGRVHTEGRLTRVALEDARTRVAAFFGARPRSVVFTSGATEAINAACFGAASRRPDGAFVAAAVEHSAVREASARHGDVLVPEVDRFGRISVDSVRALLEHNVALVHCQLANHEVATLQPVADIAALCQERGVLLHVDAAAAAGHVPIAFDDLGVDLLSLSASKFGGPVGVGALLVRRGLRIDPLLLGGDQERARRAGLEAVALVEAMAAVTDGLTVAQTREANDNYAQTCALADAALAVQGVAQYGDPVGRVPHIVCFGIEGVESEAVLLGLDQAGVAAHSGSACSSEALEPSPVLEAMGVDAQHSLRLSVGWSTTDDDVAAFANSFGSVVDKLRALRTS
ncbi:MAG TPA: cysteine desulfurase family protein [Acidimicrobiales bacterium]|nr:cysteine desulfurase family protein [Acidimicrobiales bacterium]